MRCPTCHGIEQIERTSYTPTFRGSRRTGGGGGRSFFDVVNDWADAVPKSITYILMAVGAITGYGYGVRAGAQQPLFDALVGLFAGGIAVWVFMFVLELTLYALVTAAILGFFYFLIKHS